MNKITLYNFLRKIRSYIPFIQHERQRYLEFITNQDPDDVYGTMISFGWQWNYLAYHDRGEVLNLRKLYGMRQLHFRLFEDGEVRMHDEFNAEFYPLQHLSGEEVKQVDRATVEQLREMLKGYRTD